MSNYVLLSHRLNPDTPSYGNRDRVLIGVNTSIDNGDTANTSSLTLANNHIGTHIDVPRHFSKNGKRTYDYPISDFIFEHVVIVDLPKTKACLLEPNEFKDINISSDVELLLIRTGFETKRGEDVYWNDNPGLAPELADYFRIALPKLRCIGFDFISVTSWKYRPEGRKAHRAFLIPEDGGKEIWCIEDMSLKNVSKLIKSVVVAPMLVEGGNGGPVTVIAEY